MADVRAPMSPFLDAFGVPATVRRAPPNETPLETTGFWIRPLHEEQLPVGSDMQQREPRRVVVMARTAALASLKRGDMVDAPEELGGPVVRWRVDGFDQVDNDCWRPILVFAR